MTLKRETYKYTKPFLFECGAQLDNVEIVYHTSVSSEDMPAALAEGRRVVWVCHALTANSDPSDWWADLVGDGKYFDSERDIIVCANVIGSCYGSTGPCNYGGKPLDFPVATIRDVVEAHIELRQYLGIEKIDALVGASVGGFQSLEWAIMEPEVIKNLIVIACNERITPWITAFNESQRMAIEADQTFAEQKSSEGGRAGMMAARAIALLSYRSYNGYNLTQGEADADCFRAKRSASYQNYQGKKLADRFDAYSYYYLASMLDTHNVGRGRGGVEEALKLITASCLVIGISSDLLVPPNELQHLSTLLNHAQYAQIDSLFGHDGFLIEWQALEAIIANFLKK